MVILKVTMLAGRSAEQKAELIQRITTAAAQRLNEPADGIRILVYELPPQNWGAGGITIEQREAKSRPS